MINLYHFSSYILDKFYLLHIIYKFYSFFIIIKLSYYFTRDSTYYNTISYQFFSAATAASLISSSYTF